MNRYDNDYFAIIKEYEVKNDEIIIKFTSGREETFPYEESFEKEIVNYMLTQAKERDKAINITREKLENKLLNALLGAQGVACILLLRRLQILDFQMLPDIFNVMTLAYLDFLAVRNGKKVNEHEKYNIYLNNMEKIANKEDYPDILRGVMREDLELNINTLDKYSLKDLKQIGKNIEQREEKVLRKKR